MWVEVRGLLPPPRLPVSVIYLFVYSRFENRTFCKENVSCSIAAPQREEQKCLSSSISEAGVRVAAPLLLPHLPFPPRPISIHSRLCKCHSGALRTRRHPSPRGGGGGKCHGATPLCIDPSHLKTVVFKERAARGR